MSHRPIICPVRAGAFLACMLACVLGILGLACLAPQQALANTNFTVDELSTELQVRPDGSVHAVNRQVLTFQGQNNGYIWYVYVPESGESLKMNSVRVAPVDDGGTLTGDWTRLQMIDVNRDNQGTNPGDNVLPEMRRPKTQPWYSYSISDGMMRCYFPAEDGTYMLETDYTISNYVRVYRDIADLNWRYVHASMAVAPQDITLQINLPVPADAQVVPGDNVMAWGHGPDDGTFVIGEDGTVVYHVDLLEQGQYAEAHVIFPASWMTQMRDNAPHLYTETYKQVVLADEGQWVDSYTRGAAWDFKVRMIFFALAAIALLIGVLYVLRVGMSYRSKLALIRVATVVLVLALADSLFLPETLTIVSLLVLSAAVYIAAQFLPGPGYQAEPAPQAAEEDNDELAEAEADAAEASDNELAEASECEDDDEPAETPEEGDDNHGE